MRWFSELKQQVTALSDKVDALHPEVNSQNSLPLALSENGYEFSDFYLFDFNDNSLSLINTSFTTTDSYRSGFALYNEYMYAYDNTSNNLLKINPYNGSTTSIQLPVGYENAIFGYSTYNSMQYSSFIWLFL